MLRLSSRTVAFAYGCGIIAELCGGCWVWHCRSLIPPPHCHCRFRPLRRRSCLEKQNEDGSMICPHPEISPLDQTNSTDWNYDCDWDWDFDCRKEVERFLDSAGIPQSSIQQIKPLDFRGYCNKVYSVDILQNHDIGASRNVVKIFADVAKIRMTDERTGQLSVGSMDVIASDLGIGPEVMYHSHDGLWMKFVDGLTLTESDIHECICDELCIELAELVSCWHTIEVNLSDENENVLWLTMQRMISYIENRIPTDAYPNEWSFERIQRETQFLRKSIDPLNFPEVMCHGDLKPSNIIKKIQACTSQDEKFTKNHPFLLIDFELSGRNYRGFDLYKLFRTRNPTIYTPTNMETFAKQYLKSLSIYYPKQNAETNVQSLLEEVQIFEPFTWLEAALFFLFLYASDPNEKWMELASSRLQSYEGSKVQFSVNIDKYMTIIPQTTRGTIVRN